MYDMHSELNEFYNDHVRLKSERSKLAEYRDTNLESLKAGLDNLEFQSTFQWKNQGSYAMYTINKHLENDYDIDVAIIFDQDDLPSSPADARKRIENAMIEGGGNFKDPPKAKTNAVRVSYAKGHHIDLAIYRKCIEAFGNEIIEHAGSEWTTRDPMEITNWFITAVDTKSPSKKSGATVEDKQMRRIVRWIKMFAKSRSEWNAPGGLIISTLVEECYVPNQNRDDSSLYDTMASIRSRLSSNKEVNNPANPSQLLTNREKDKTRMENLEKYLEEALDDLNVLFSLDCTHPKAMQAWNCIFKHSFWDISSDESSNEASNIEKDGPTIIVHPPKQHYND